MKQGATLAEIVPGVIYRGDDIDRWLTRQQRDFGRLDIEHQQRIAQLGVEATASPAPAAPSASSSTKKSSTKNGAATAQAARGTDAFRRGPAALAQYVEREQRTLVPRQHAERTTVDGQDHEVRLGVWISNQKNRRDKLNGEQLAQLATLGMDWVEADRPAFPQAPEVRKPAPGE